MKLKYFYFLLFISIFNTFSQKKIKQIDKYLFNKVVSNNLLASDILEYKITDYTKSKNNVEHYYFRQQHQGIEILGTESSIHIFKNKIISASDKFIKDKGKIIKSYGLNSKSPENVIIDLAREMGYHSPVNLYRKNSNNITNGMLFSKAGISKKEIPLKKVFYLNKKNIITLGWELSIYEMYGESWWDFIVNDNTGKIVSKVNWIKKCNHTNNHESKKFSNNNNSKLNKRTTTINNSSYNVFGYPIENPNFGTRSITPISNNSEASPYGWHDTDGILGAEYTVTRGNNVNAFKNSNGQIIQPNGGTELIFDFPFNETFSLSDQSENAAITNVFYWNNIIHDIIYEYGFDEESGNFQSLNYTNLGEDDDDVLAQVHSSESSCNAWFASPPDGINGEMTMFTCENRDGSFDNHVIVHEYAHGISTRLTGGPSNSNCLDNDEQMGEGWSDWYANMLTMTQNDLPTDLRAVGTWLLGQDRDGTGIRDFPYTTDLSVDPRTYNSIINSRSTHQVGSVWAAMLWELTWGLINTHGFDEDIYKGTGGNNIALALVTEALKIQPCSPGFVDGRNAILSADQILYNGANQCIIWDAFAKRGLGFSAQQGSSFSVNDGTEAFDSPSLRFNLSKDSFCEIGNITEVFGGEPFGGVYSGPGVTDNGNGTSFNFDPNIAGIGIHTITYTQENDCSNGNTISKTIEVKDKTPEITCKNISITLDENDSGNITPSDIIEGFARTNEYTINTAINFNPENISSIETPVSLSDDDLSRELPIGFSFNFFGEDYTNFKISSNGFITFNNDFDSGCCSGQTLPSNSTPNNLIAFAWTDLVPDRNNFMSYATIGEAPNRILIVNANNIRRFGTSNNNITSQVKIFENSDIIEIHSTNVSSTDMTQGIENINGTEAYFVEGRNSATFSLTNDAISFSPGVSGLPNECGLENTITLEKDSFTCSDLGENIIVVTVTDSEGNSSTCSSTVTVLPFQSAELNIENTSFCIDQERITNLGGGFPEGGIYSGNGVIDDGNGTSFSFDPSSLDIGFQTISYEFTNTCGTTSRADSQIEIIQSIPDIQCRDITISLDTNGVATLTPQQLISNNGNNGELFAIIPFGDNSNNDISKYFYNISSDEIEPINSFSRNTGLNFNVSMDYNSATNEYYLLNREENISNLYRYNIDDENAVPVFIDEIISVNQEQQSIDMTFDGEGNLYFIFANGEINKYDIVTNTISAFANTDSSFNTFDQGITYDFDNNRLIYSNLNNLFSIDILTGEVTRLFNFMSNCNSEGLEYVGNNKLIVTSTICDEIYTINLDTQEVETILNSTGLREGISDLVFVKTLPRSNCNGETLTFTLNKSSFNCSDLGENEISITVTDNNGNSSICNSTVNVIDRIAPQITTIENYTIDLNSSGSGNLTLDDILVSASDNCENEISFEISKTEFDCNEIGDPENIQLIDNGSFEEDMTNWSVIVNPTNLSTNTNCTIPWIVQENSNDICCCVDNIIPTDKSKAAFTSFDSNQDNTIYTIEQTITIPNTIINTAELSFDWVANFDLTFGAILKRDFTVTLTTLSDEIISTLYNYEIAPNERTSVNENVNIHISSIISSRAGENLKLKFSAFIPERSTGPAKSLIDNVSLTVSSLTNEFNITTTATDSNGNSSSSVTKVNFTNIIKPCPVLSNNSNFILENNLKIFPNPTRDNITLDWFNTELSKFEIYDTNGRIILTKKLKGYNGKEEISLKLFSSGIYFLKLFNGEKVTVKKFIKEK